MVKAVRRWLGNKPVNCDFCGKKFDAKDDKHFYDFQNSLDGRWGLGCKKCFDRYGVGLGTGKGQKYDLKTLIKKEG